MKRLGRPLCSAAYRGDREAVTRLLSEGARADSKDVYRKTPIMHASINGHLGVVRLLVHSMDGKGVEERDQAHKTALHYAAEGGHEEIVAFSLGKGAQAHSRDRTGTTPLMYALAKGHLGVVCMLVERIGERVLEEEDRAGRTALHWAAVWGFQELVVFQLRRGAQAHACDKQDMTPLILASSNGHLSVVKLLLEHLEGQGLEEADWRGRTALQDAALMGHEEIVTFLLSRGAQAQLRDYEGITPFMHAASGGFMGVVRSLLPYIGAHGLEERDEEGRTALGYAAMWGHEDVVFFLLSKGARADTRDIFGTTALMQACCGGSMGAVRLLVEHREGQGLEDRATDGRTALDYAAQRGHAEVVAFLLGKGAVANEQEAVGVMPLLEAATAGHLKVVQVLLGHLGEQGLRQRRAGWTVLHCASATGAAKVVKCLLLAGADPLLRDLKGRRPRDLAERPEPANDDSDDESSILEAKGHPDVLAVFDWWDRELERGRILYRATCLHKVHTIQRDKPTSQVPTYLEARVAGGHELPRVEMVASQSQEHQEKGQAEATGKRKAAGEPDDLPGAEAEDDELHMMMGYVVRELNEALVTELLEGFPS